MIFVFFSPSALLNLVAVCCPEIQKKMEGCPNKDPQLLDLIPKDREWLLQRDDEHRSHESLEEKKLELRLGPPGDREDSNLSIAHLTNTLGSKRGFPSFPEKPVLSPPWLSSSHERIFTLHSALFDRSAPAPVVGWPPIRSFRKNISSSGSSKQTPESQNVAPSKVPSGQPTAEVCRKSLFVKINMDGVPIGRKVDLQAYDSYEKLSSAIDDLFRDLAAQMDPSANGMEDKQLGERAIPGLLDGTGEYTVVYEDNEGDRVLVGDVPWHMFVSTVKRLRVLKSSELSTLQVGSKQSKIPLDVKMKIKRS
ncbi:unnamed protein product [Thlaspi arvense]|uniref:Auxin-responsive protein n=1 Tax=Thlaspi arvense TaxID=13288 RepID=A0AAU9S410_THLAR|nr:unnamed protein product [Thlaspi arvense]